MKRRLTMMHSVHGNPQKFPSTQKQDWMRRNGDDAIETTGKRRTVLEKQPAWGWQQRKNDDTGERCMNRILLTVLELFDAKKGKGQPGESFKIPRACKKKHSRSATTSHLKLDQSKLGGPIPGTSVSATPPPPHLLLPHLDLVWFGFTYNFDPILEFYYIFNGMK